MFIRFFIASVTGLLYNTTQTLLTPVKTLHLLLYTWIFLRNKRKFDGIVLAKGFIKNSGEVVLNLALMSGLYAFETPST